VINFLFHLVDRRHLYHGCSSAGSSLPQLEQCDPLGVNTVISGISGRPRQAIVKASSPSIPAKRLHA
jgi:hypothetical protein